jgi:hypothetical protein
VNGQGGRIQVGPVVFGNVMKHNVLLVAGLSALWFADPNGCAAPTRSFANPYAVIAERNLFDLRPRLTAVPPRPPAPAPQVTLTGITTILPTKRALLEVAQPASGHTAAHKDSYILTEGQRQGPVEVMKIDEKTDSVTADIYGKVMVLTFEKNGPKLPKARPAPHPPILPTTRRFFLRPRR